MTFRGELGGELIPFRPSPLARQSSAMTVHHLALFNSYQRSAGIAEKTIRGRSQTIAALERHIGVPARDATLEDLRTYIGRPSIAAGTRRTYRNHLRAFYQWLQEDGYREDDPSARLKPVHVPKGAARPFSADHVERMLTSGAYRKTRAMILLGHYQGFRVSSIVRVRGEELDLIAMTIYTKAKGGKERVLPLHPVIAELATTMPRAGWWFPARKDPNRHMRAESATDLITRAKKRAAITDPTLSPHSLRHGFATDLVEEGVDVRVVQELMMHESLSSTQIYTAVSDRRKREGIAALRSRPLPRRSGRRAA